MELQMKDASGVLDPRWKVLILGVCCAALISEDGMSVFVFPICRYAMMGEVLFASITVSAITQKPQMRHRPSSLCTHARITL